LEIYSWDFIENWGQEMIRSLIHIDMIYDALGTEKIMEKNV